MVDTPNFKITEVDPNQNDKEVTINEAFNEFEDLLSEEFADAAVTGNTTLTEANYTRNFHFVYGGQNISGLGPGGSGIHEPNNGVTDGRYPEFQDH